MIERHIHKLNVNPFLGSLIIQSFYNGYKQNKCALLLHYLILPLVMYSDIRDILTSINKRGDLKSVVQLNKVAFVDTQEKIWLMRRLTNLTLINLHTKNKITLKAEVIIHATVNYEHFNHEIKNYLRAANYLGILFSTEETENIYKHLKVIP